MCSIGCFYGQDGCRDASRPICVTKLEAQGLLPGTGYGSSQYPVTGVGQHCVLVVQKAFIS